VSSAGTRAAVGQPIHPSTANVLKRLGGNPSGFAARQLTSRIALEADLIVTMTRAHRDAVLELAPRQLHRTFTLGEAARIIAMYEVGTVSELASRRAHLSPSQALEVADPMGQGPEFHAKIGAQIAEMLDPILEFCRDSSVSTAD